MAGALWQDPWICKGGWVCINIIFPFPEHCFKNFLSPTIFCMSVDIAKVWYPRLDPDNDEEPKSHTVTGPDAFEDVRTWAWNKHNEWLARD